MTPHNKMKTFITTELAKTFAKKYKDNIDTHKTCEVCSTTKVVCTECIAKERSLEGEVFNGAGLPTNLDCNSTWMIFHNWAYGL